MFEAGMLLDAVGLEAGTLVTGMLIDAVVGLEAGTLVAGTVDAVVGLEAGMFEAGTFIYAGIYVAPAWFDATSAIQ